MSGPVWSAIITAVGAVVAAFIGGVFASHSQAIRVLLPGIAAPPATETVTASAQGGATSSGHSGSQEQQGGNGQSTSRRVFHSGSGIVISSGQGVDLDAPPTDGTWGQSGSSNENFDVFWNETGNSGGLQTFSTKIVRVQSPDPQSCSSATGYNVGGYSPTSVHSGDTFCVVTNGPRFSFIKVTDVSPGAVTLDITTLANQRD